MKNKIQKSPFLNLRLSNEEVKKLKHNIVVYSIYSKGKQASWGCKLARIFKEF
jgi:hypothetical protein